MIAAIVKELAPNLIARNSISHVGGAQLPSEKRAPRERQRPDPLAEVFWGAVEGYAIGALESPRASITTLSRHFGFDAVESVTDLTLFGGANALAIESAPGVWEIVQASTAELLAPGRYRLTRLLRGQRGTESAMGNPAPAGARVVVLDASLASLPIAEADLGIPWNWRIGPASRPVSDETYVAQAFTPVGVGLRPFSVAHVEQPWRTPRTPGDLTIRWTRRSRALAADSGGGLEVQLAEELEAYEVEILDGATVKRVLSTSTTSAVYTAAQQTADWGGPLGTGDTLDIRISQLSALVGRGVLKTVTLTF